MCLDASHTLCEYTLALRPLPHAGEGCRLLEPRISACELVENADRPPHPRWQAQVVRQIHIFVERLGASRDSRVN